jgi:alkyl hydroperoxide reductase subunit F
VEFGSLSFDWSPLEDAARPDPSQTYDLLILGGGPAAMAAALYAARKMMKTALLTRDFGGQMVETSEIDNYLGFQMVTGRELVERFQQHVRHFHVPIGLGEKIEAVTKSDSLFTVALESGTAFRARAVIVATGKRERMLNVPGEKELVGKGVAYCATCDAPFFKDKRVVVAGGANSAFTAAADLLKVAKEVTLVNFATGWQADEILQRQVREQPHVRLLDHHAVTRIDGAQSVTGVQVRNRETNQETNIPADGIFVEIGLIPNSEPVRHLAKLNEAGEVIVDCHCRSSVPGLFGAGDVTTVPHKQILISAGEGAKAALSAYEYLARQAVTREE